MSVKILSQNAMSWEAEYALFDERRPLMERAVRESGADIIGFQEVTPRWTEFFESDLSDYGKLNVYRAKDNLEGTPIYWKKDKLEVIDSGHFWLSETPNEESLGWDAKCKRITIWILFKNTQTGTEFAFVNTHLDHRGENARVNGIQLICDFIIDKFGKDIPLILTGDFNAQPGSETIKKADSLLVDARTAAKDTTDEHTFHGFKDLKSIIDYIYLNRNIECEKFEIIKKTDGKTYQSDHFGVMATVDL